MSPAHNDLAHVEQRLNINIKPEEVDDYLILITATDNAARAVMEMPDCTPVVDYFHFPRTDPKNAHRGWACKATIQGVLGYSN